MRVLLLLFSALFCFVASAQKVDKYLFLGKEATEAKEFYKAAEFYRQGALLTTSNPELNFNYAECLRTLNNYDLAEKFHQLTLDNDSANQYPISLYWLAVLQKNNGKYKESLGNWELIKRLNANDPNSDVYRKAEQEIIGCSAILNGAIPSYSYSIRNVESLNTINAEFAASYYDTMSMVYSKVEVDKLQQKKSESNIELHSSIREYGDWREGFLLPPAINQTGYQNANGTFSSDRRYFLFTRCDQNLSCMLYISVYKNGVYSEAFPLKINAPGFSSTQPHMAKTDNGYVIFFSSNRPGGKGGLDIWYCTADDKLNLGPVRNVPEVNSPEDDITPFYYHPTKELFYSSSWFTNLGGYDIFKSKTEDLNRFSDPENIGRPYNSPANDSYFNMSSQGYKGMLTSNREGSISSFGKTCCNDIYEFDYPVYLIEKLPKKNLQPKPAAEPSVRIKELYAELSALLPLTLYFHNDEPDPKSVKNFTQLSYQDCYYNYYAVKNRYDDVDRDQSYKIFNELVQPGYDKLQRYLNISSELMKLGAAIELDIKGYASPLAKSNYNVNLTGRRIESFMNYLKVYNEGFLLPFVVARGDQAQIRVKKLPFGETKSAAGVSDDYYKQELSVYSYPAAKERRIEIVATRLIDPVKNEPLLAKVETKPVVEPIKTDKAKTTDQSTSKPVVKKPEDKKVEAEQKSEVPVSKSTEKAVVKTDQKKEISKPAEVKASSDKATLDKPSTGKIDKPNHPNSRPIETAKPQEKPEVTAPLEEDLVVPVDDPIYLTNLIELNLGKVKRGELLVKKIKFRNSYGKNINFSKVIADCGCTDVKLSTRLLVPEEETVFTLLYETRGKMGVQEGEAKILTKEIDGNIRIKFKVEVVP